MFLDSTKLIRRSCGLLLGVLLHGFFGTIFSALGLKATLLKVPSIHQKL